MSSGGAQAPISLFYSYSHKDEHWRLKLKNHLAFLVHSGIISEWTDRDIDVGQEWEKEIDQNLSSADIILLLVSASFIASKYCWSVEVKKALERHHRGEAKVIPVILRPCHWTSTPLSKLQAAPKDAKPVLRWADADEAFCDVVSKIERVVNDLQGKRARSAGRPQSIPDFAVFRDIDVPWCPEMVALPAGEFMMGSPQSDGERFKDELPQHRVTISYRFGVGRYAVTVGEYRHFVEVAGRDRQGRIYTWTDSEWEQDASKNWRDPGFDQSDRDPVVGISWQDAQAYVEWLSRKTEQAYRLPSEAEWEYACRSGTTTRYSFGDAITPKDANYSESELGKTTEVGAYPPNAWGLHDMHGNGWEWVKDVWHDNYKGAPADGSAWTDGEGGKSFRSRVFRGGSWDNVPRNLRSAIRNWGEPGLRSFNLGFRVARTLG